MFASSSPKNGAQPWTAIRSGGILGGLPMRHARDIRATSRLRALIKLELTAGRQAVYGRGIWAPAEPGERTNWKASAIKTVAWRTAWGPAFPTRS